MGDLRVTLPNGLELGFEQALAIRRKIEELGHAHWHMNDCGCCATVHGSDCAYVIGPDGHETFFASRGCACAEDADDPS